MGDGAGESAVKTKEKKMEDKIEELKKLFTKLLLEERDIENITATFSEGGLTCIQIRGEKTMLRLGTFAIRAQDILGL